MTNQTTMFSNPDTLTPPLTPTIQSAKSAYPSAIPTIPIDEAFALFEEYNTDQHPSKVSLGIGVYRDDEGLPYSLPSVRVAEERFCNPNNLHRHDYLPCSGYQPFLACTRDLVLGPLPAETQSRIASVQTVAGTHANHLGAVFLNTWMKPRCVWLPVPTWPNHLAIWSNAGIPIRTYPYLDPASLSLDFTGMLTTLENEAQPGDVLLLHACAHNPSGADPSREQWMRVAELCLQRGLFAFFDCAYQGFASGDVDADMWGLRHFFGAGVPMAVAQSCSKTFGLYGQRAGALHVVLSEEDAERGCTAAVVSQLASLVRKEVSTCPSYGAFVVTEVLEDEVLRKAWVKDLRNVSLRLRKMRVMLYEELRRLETPGDWRHIVNQVGMFSYTGLTSEQALSLRRDHHVYILSTGRISIAGLTSQNIAYVAKAIDFVVRAYTRLPTER